MSGDREPINVLVVENSQHDTELVVDHLEQAGFKVSFERVESSEEMTRALREGQWDLIVSDFILSAFTALDALQITQQFELDIPFIIVSGGVEEDLAVQAMRAGASDYLMKDRMARLGAAVQRELRAGVLQRERRRMEQENLRLGDELRVKAEQLARTNQELERFAYLAAHDLQEPLRMVMAYAELLVKRYHQRVDSDVDRIVEFIQTGVDRMETLIRGLIAYSRTLNDDQPIPCPTPLDNIVGDALTGLQQMISDSGATVDYGPLPRVLADSAKLRLVFEQLIGNAIKFKKPEIHPRILIEADSRNGDVVVSVRDNGIGIDPQYADQIFGLFKRLHRDDSSGLGMGLALSRRIIEQHGGRIWVESSVGQGAAFFFTLRPVPPPAEE